MSFKRHGMYFLVTLLIVALIGWGAMSAVPPIPKLFDQQDKLEHIMAFAALTLWLAAMMGPKRIIFCALIAFLGAFALELAQGLLSQTRTGSLFDLVASAVGILLAVLFVERNNPAGELCRSSSLQASTAKT